MKSFFTFKKVVLKKLAAKWKTAADVIFVTTMFVEHRLLTT